MGVGEKWVVVVNNSVPSAKPGISVFPAIGRAGAHARALQYIRLQRGLYLPPREDMVEMTDTELFELWPEYTDGEEWIEILPLETEEIPAPSPSVTPSPSVPKNSPSKHPDGPIGTLAIDNVNLGMLDAQRATLSIIVMTPAFQTLPSFQQQALDGILNMLDAWADERHTTDG